MLDARCSMLDARCSMLDARCSMLDARCSMQQKRKFLDRFVKGRADSASGFAFSFAVTSRAPRFAPGHG
jgi:hypothetical protein